MPGAAIVISALSADILHLSLNDTEPAPLRLESPTSTVSSRVSSIVIGTSFSPSSCHRKVTPPNRCPCTFDGTLKEERPVGIQEADETPRCRRCEDRNGSGKVAEFGCGTLRNREDERSYQPASALARIRPAGGDLPAVDDTQRIAPHIGNAGDDMDGLIPRSSHCA